MKKLKRLIAIFAAAALALTCAACRPKGEIAGEIKDSKSKESIEITTAQYLYALSTAVQEANSLIDEANADKEIEDYAKYKVVETDENGEETKTKYEKWVNARCDEILRDYAASLIKAKLYEIELTEDELQTAEGIDDETWQTNYYYLYNNGVGAATYYDILNASTYKSKYFDVIYGEDGEKPLEEEEYTDYFNKNFALANIIVLPTSEGLDGEEETTEGTEETETLSVSAAKTLLKDYRNQLKNGKIEFSKAYAELMETYDSETAEASVDEEGNYAEDVAQTVVYSSEVGSYYESTYSSLIEYYASMGYAYTLGDLDPSANYVDYFDTVMEMKNGAYKIIEAEDGSSVMLIQKLDINEIEEHEHEEGEEVDHEEGENTYLASYSDTILHILKDDEFNKEFTEFAESLKIELNSAVDGITYEDVDLATAEEGTTQVTTEEGTTQE